MSWLVEQLAWILLACVGSVLGTLVCVLVGRAVELLTND